MGRAEGGLGFSETPKVGGGATHSLVLQMKTLTPEMLSVTLPGGTRWHS